VTRVISCAIRNSQRAYRQLEPLSDRPETQVMVRTEHLPPGDLPGEGGDAVEGVVGDDERVRFVARLLDREPMTEV
jgi:hypothetical protein